MRKLRRAIDHHLGRESFSRLSQLDIPRGCPLNAFLILLIHREQRTRCDGPDKQRLISYFLTRGPDAPSIKNSAADERASGCQTERIDDISWVDKFPISRIPNLSRARAADLTTGNRIQ